MQCEMVVSRADMSEERARLDALGCVRALSLAHLESVDTLEASLFSVLQASVCSSEGIFLCCDEQESCWLALFVLGCRNGVEVAGSAETLEQMTRACAASVTSLGSAAAGDMDSALRTSCAEHRVGRHCPEARQSSSCVSIVASHRLRNKDHGSYFEDDGTVQQIHTVF